MNNTVLCPPLKMDHPLIFNGTVCPLCSDTFKRGQRVVLFPVEEGEEGENVQAKPAHAICLFEGYETEYGIIASIKEGDASPYPIVLTNGQQITFKEAGLC